MSTLLYSMSQNTVKEMKMCVCMCGWGEGGYVLVSVHAYKPWTQAAWEETLVES